jgi:hypothetical protein
MFSLDKEINKALADLCTGRFLGHAGSDSNSGWANYTQLWKEGWGIAQGKQRNPL